MIFNLVLTIDQFPGENPCKDPQGSWQDPLRILLRILARILKDPWGSCDRILKDPQGSSRILKDPLRILWRSLRILWGSCEDPWGSCQDPWGSCEDPRGSFEDPWGSCQDPWGSLRIIWGSCQDPQGSLSKDPVNINEDVLATLLWQEGLQNWCYCGQLILYLKIWTKQDKINIIKDPNILKDGKA